MMHLADTRFAFVTKQFRMEIVTLVRWNLVHLHLDAMRVGPSVLTDAGDLPGNFHVWLVGLDGECVIRNLGSNPGLSGLADGCELIAEFGVQSLEPHGHADDGCAAAVGDGIAVIDIHHVGRFDEGMVEVFIRGIERMIDLEGTTGLAERANNVHIALEISRDHPDGAFCVNSDATCAATSLSGSPVCVYAVTTKYASAPGGCQTVAPRADGVVGGAALGIDARPARITRKGANSAERVDARSASAPVGSSAIPANSITATAARGC